MSGSSGSSTRSRSFSAAVALQGERLLHNARQKNPQLSLIVSTTDDQDVAALATAGAGTVFPENFAAGLTLADQVLNFLAASRGMTLHA